MHPPDRQTDEVGEQNPRFVVPGRLGWVLCLSRHSITLMVRAWSLEPGVWADDVSCTVPGSLSQSSLDDIL